MNSEPAPSATHALVLSGGGANGAYELGVLKALFAGKARGLGTVEPEIFTGTSIGGFNAAYLAANWEEYGAAAITRLERVWLERVATGAQGVGNGAYRFRDDPLELLDPRAYVPNPVEPLAQAISDTGRLGWDATQRLVNFGSSFFSSAGDSIVERLTRLFNFSSFVSVEPWVETIKANIDFENLRRTRRKLRIAATDWTNGELRVFENHDMSDRRGPEIIRASSALPGFFPPAHVGAEVFVDGGVLMNTPLKPAIRAGADVLHVIYMDPDIRNIALDQLENTLSTFYRMQMISWAAAIKRDIARADGLNKGLDSLQEISRLMQERGLSEQALRDRADELQELIAFAPKFEERLELSLDLLLAARKTDDIKREIERVRAERAPGEKAFYRRLTIHRYHPTDDLGGILGFLNLNRERLEELIERGFQDALVHDCKKARCAGVGAAEEAGGQEAG